MSLSHDPRVPQGSTYDRQAVVDAVTGFYNLLSALPYVKPEDVIHPPHGGWPSITSSQFAAFGKTDEVVTLLKHLPYLKQDDPGCPYLIGPDVCPTDFRGPFFTTDLITSPPAKDMLNPIGAEHLPAWTVPLTYAKSRDGRYAILDTSDGTVTEYEIVSSGFENDYEESDSRAWRNECFWQEDPTDRTLPVAEYFGRLGDKFRQLEWIGFWRRDIPTLWLGCDFWFRETEKMTAEMRDIIRAHGWPDRFARQTCERALKEYVERNHPWSRK